MKQKYYLGLSEEGFHKIAYFEWEAITEIPVICVHGLTRNAHDFDELADYLNAHGRYVYCPDIVGRGDSDWLKNPLHYTYEQYISDMNALIARTGAKQVDWIGTSMGGLIGMVLASMANSPIRSLVLNDVGPQIPVKAIARLTQYAGKDPNFTSISEAKKYFQTIYASFGNLTDAQWQRFTENSVREISPGKYATKIDQGIKLAPTKSKLAWQLLMHPHKALEGTFFDIDLWHIWRKITCPVLVIHGKNSDILLPEIIEKMRSSHTVEVIEIEETGHAPALLDVKLQEKIYAWLQKLI